MKITNFAKSCRMARQNIRYNLKTSKTTQQPKFIRETSLKPEKKVIKTGKKCKIRPQVAYWHGKKEPVRPKLTKITPSTQSTLDQPQNSKNGQKIQNKGEKDLFTKKW